MISHLYNAEAGRRDHSQLLVESLHGPKSQPQAIANAINITARRPLCSHVGTELPLECRLRRLASRRRTKFSAMKRNSSLASGSPSVPDRDPNNPDALIADSAANETKNQPQKFLR